MLKWMLTLCALLCPTLSCADDARFDAAVEGWLSGDDETTLPLLAALAQEGHSLSRILLAQIEVKDRGHSPYRAGLKPAEARAIFRVEAGYGGFSKSWLSVEADGGSALAQTLLATRHPRATLPLIAELRSLGEVQATDYPIRAIALYGTDEEKRALFEGELMLDELRPFLTHQMSEPIWHGDGIAALRHIAPFAAEMIENDDPETTAIAGMLALGVSAGPVDPSNRWRGLVEDWVLTAPATRAMADLCRIACADDVTGCSFAMLGLSGGYHEAIRLDTPLETVISQDRFLASPRARLMTLRRAALAKQSANRGWLASLDEIASISQCAANLVEDTRLQYP